MDWTPAPTNTHQDHVIAHVVGATVLGYFGADEAAHFVLDIGFIWTILLDGEMALTLERTALAELNVAEDERAALRADVRALYETDTHTPLARIAPAPVGCQIVAVEFYTDEARRRLLIECESANLCVETMLATGAVEITAQPAE
ncbi:MAG: hypothetical protein DMF64_08370 [Acidobacteria bacterium]|nr:MAG: hypothetical protein DMF64_08370 [Acidobacteriota bacterium]